MNELIQTPLGWLEAFGEMVSFAVRMVGELMTGLVIDQAIAARDVSEAEPLLEVRGLTRLGEYQDVSLTLRRGEVLGLTGLLGAGRTELALSWQASNATGRRITDRPPPETATRSVNRC